MRRLAVASILLTLPAFAAQADEVVVFAAASLKTALDEVAADFETATGHTVTISYAGSNALARQIIEGAPADIFISASEEWMDEVEAASLVAPDSRRDVLGNSLVLVAHGSGGTKVEIGPGFDLRAMLGEGKLAMAMVDSVPVGQYGKEALVALGIWDAVEGAVVQTENARSALALVAMDEAPFGVVYGSDAASEPGVSVVGTFPEDSHRPIVYPAALLTGATDAADAAFFRALSADAADAAFARAGFAVID